jgi:prevent-host-death family protein
MIAYSVGTLKTHLSEILERVRSGEEIAITKGRNKEIVAYLVPPTVKAKKKRPLGLLEGKAKVTFGDDFEISELAFLGL